MDSTDNRIIIRCRKCNQRMFDYVSGDMHIEMKCNKCKRVLVMKNYTESIIRANAVKGEYRIQYNTRTMSGKEIKINKQGPPDKGNSK